ncbi:MAG: hypothetical protein AAF404_10275 [Pseudomonadota bacterium]
MEAMVITDEQTTKIERQPAFSVDDSVSDRAALQREKTARKSSPSVTVDNIGALPRPAINAELAGPRYTGYQWLNKQPSSHYTLLLTSANQPLAELISRLETPSAMAEITANGGTLRMWVVGSFQSADQAMKAIDEWRLSEFAPRVLRIGELPSPFNR